MLPFGIEDFGRWGTRVHDSLLHNIFHPFAQGTVTDRSGGRMLKATRPILLTSRVQILIYYGSVSNTGFTLESGHVVPKLATSGGKHA